MPCLKVPPKLLTMHLNHMFLARSYFRSSDWQLGRQARLSDSDVNLRAEKKPCAHTPHGPRVVSVLILHFLPGIRNGTFVAQMAPAQRAWDAWGRGAHASPRPMHTGPRQSSWLDSHPNPNPNPHSHRNRNRNLDRIRKPSPSSGPSPSLISDPSPNILAEAHLRSPTTPRRAAP